jgi:F-type H+-transporting ATPase subunit b
VNINATLIAQCIVFLIFAWFTMRFVWPPVMKALDERRDQIRSGLEAAEQSQKNLKANADKIEHELVSAREKGAKAIADSQKQAQNLAFELKTKAEKDAERIIKDAKDQALQEANKVKDALKDQFSTLVLKGVEQVLKKEVDATAHAGLLNQLKAEL